MTARLDLYGNSNQSFLMPDLNMKMTRLEEKYALQRIGDRFNNYTNRVNQLTDTNQKLESLLSNSKLTEEELKAIKEMYEAELKESRHLLDTNNAEISKQQEINSKTAALARDLQSRVEDEAAARKKADESLMSTEQALSHKEALLLAAFREHDEDRRTIAQAMREKDELRANLAASKKGHERETLLRVEAENCVNATRQELAFVKDMNEKDTRTLNDKIHDLEVINTNLEKDLRREFEHRLQCDLSEARQRLDKLAHAQKNEFEAKMRTKLKAAQTQSDQDQIRLNSISDENAQLRIQNDALKAQVNNLIGKNNALEDTLRNTTHSLEHERSHNALTMSQTVTELKELKERYHYKCLECDELQDARVPLQCEIDAMKDILDKNESILRYRTEVKSSASRRPVTAAQLTGQQLTTAAQRYVADDTMARSPSAPAARTSPRLSHSSPIIQTATKELWGKTDTSSFSTGNVKIWDVHDRGDYVRLVNTSTHDEFLGGCVIQQTVAQQAYCSYKFPPNYVLRGGAMTTIWANQSQALHNPPTDLVWKDQEAWAVGPDCNTILYKPNGQAFSGINNTNTSPRQKQKSGSPRLIKSTLGGREPLAYSSPNIISYKHNKHRDEFLAAAANYTTSDDHDYRPIRPKSAYN